MGFFQDPGLTLAWRSVQGRCATDDDPTEGKEEVEWRAAMDENERKLSSPPSPSSSLIGQNHATKSVLVPTFNFFNRDRSGKGLTTRRETETWGIPSQMFLWRITFQTKNAKTGVAGRRSLFDLWEIFLCFNSSRSRKLGLT